MRRRLTVLILLSLSVGLTYLPFGATGAGAGTTTGAPTAQGSQLLLNGAPYKFTGVNAYELATDWGVNAGCGPMASDAQLDALFASLRPNSLVRFWGWQGLATNYTTKTRDWRGIDRVVDAAARHGQRLIFVLSGQWVNGCDDGHWKDAAWYTGGYTQAFNDNGMGIAPVSFWNYMHEVAARYGNSPAIGMWELVNEPEARPTASAPCDETSARNALRSFFDNVGSELHRIAPNQLIESGTIGGGQCGTAGANYQYVHSSAGVDVASLHDYGADDQAMPGDQWNGFQVRLDQSKAMNKPIIVGEVGMQAQPNVAGCMSFTDRTTKMQVKMTAQFTAGISGFVPWNWSPTNEGTCNYDTSPGDPLLNLLATFPLGTANPTTTTTTLPVTTTTTLPVTTTTTLPVTTTTSLPVTTTTVPVPTDSIPPSVPLSLLAGSASRIVNLSWLPSVDTGGSGLAGYEVFRRTGTTGAFTKIATTTDVRFADSGVKRRTTYSYFVRAYDGAGNRSLDSLVVYGIAQ